jgi:hypothetical protein
LGATSDHLAEVISVFNLPFTSPEACIPYGP